MCISDRIGSVLGGFVAASAIGVGIASLFAVDNVADPKFYKGENRSREKVELDLSYARLHERIAKEAIGPEDARNAIARWHAEHEKELTKLRELEREAHSAKRLRQGSPSLPDSVPDNKLLEKGEFAEAAELYFRQGWEACSSDEATAGNPEKARDNYSRWMEQKAQMKLGLLLKKTKKEIWREHNRAMKPDPVLSPEELAKLDPEERIREEIYERVLALYTTPLAEGEEDRDRMGQIQDFHKAKLKALSKIGMEHRSARASARVKELEAELANTTKE